MKRTKITNRKENSFAKSFGAKSPRNLHQNGNVNDNKGDRAIRNYRVSVRTMFAYLWRSGEVREARIQHTLIINIVLNK